MHRPKSAALVLPVMAAVVTLAGFAAMRDAAPASRVLVREAAAYDTSRPLVDLARDAVGLVEPERRRDPSFGETVPLPVRGARPSPGSEIEQTSHGTRPPLVLLESFDGHGFGTSGPHGPGAGNNPSDNSLAVGPHHIMETVNSRIAIYTKRGALHERSGEPVFGPISTNVIFTGFGGECERAPNGDAVVRWDQLAERWLVVMPLFRRAPTSPGEPPGPYGMCYAVSAGANPMGAYHRYYFERELFPDYPRPAIWLDGYYVPTSTGDDIIEKHACVVERDRMLRGEPAREQCIIIPDVNFLNNADIDGRALPPAGAPNIMMATGGTQLRGIFEDDGIYVWSFHTDWDDPSRTRVDGPRKIVVAPYRYLCNGQLTRCVPQPGTDMRLDSQGDKIMQRLVYRNVDGVESMVAVHSVETAAGAGGVRWYEFRLDDRRDVVLHQQGTYAPDSSYRWMASPAMDRRGNIGIGYSFGGTPHFAGQRFAGRLRDDPPGALTFRETVMVEGGAAQTNTLRWQDYVQTAMDPDDDCTIWYVGDYLKPGAPSYTARIGAFRLPDCMRGTLGGSAFFDINRNGLHEPNEPGLVGWRIVITGARPAPAGLPPSADTLMTDAEGAFRTWMPADPAYYEATYTIAAQRPTHPSWTVVDRGVAWAPGGTVPMRDGVYTVRLTDAGDVARLGFGFACTVAGTGGAGAAHWRSAAGREVLRTNEPQPGVQGRGRGAAAQGWRGVINTIRFLAQPGGGRFEVSGTFDDAYGRFIAWLDADAGDPDHRVSRELAVASLDVQYGSRDGRASVRDPASGEWLAIGTLLGRVSAVLAARARGDAAAAGAPLAAYADLLRSINDGTAPVTPSDPAICPLPFAN